MSYDNEMRGALFRNENKRDGKRDPDYTGRVTISGTEYFLDAWINASKAGKKYISINVKHKGAPQPARDPRVTKYASSADQRQQQNFDDSEIPF